MSKIKTDLFTIYVTYIRAPQVPVTGDVDGHFFFFTSDERGIAENSHRLPFSNPASQV